MDEHDDVAIRPATGADLPHLVEVLVRAFATDPVHEWLFPDELAREDRQRRLFGRVLSLYTKHGLVFTTGNRGGVALWDPPRHGGPSLAELARFALRVLPVFGWRFLLVARGMAPMTVLHPDAPHWYLSILGTDPARQRGGVGGALLRHVLADCDRGGTMAYLEASRVENVSFYERFGFEVVAPLAMPSGPTLYRMERRPRPDFSEESPAADTTRRPPPGEP